MSNYGVEDLLIKKMFSYMDDPKSAVKNFWNSASCGEDLYLSTSSSEGYLEQSKIRYELEPYILKFVDFGNIKTGKILEIGVGLGADHQLLAESGANLYGIDLTERAISYTRHRFQCFGLKSELTVSDAENLDFSSNTFDGVYSWGVLHHSPNTPKAIAEVRRVLKPNGVAKIMIYHKWSLVGIMLWFRYAVLQFQPWIGLDHIYKNYLESPGTKAYSIDEARRLFVGFSEVKISTVLTHGDLLVSKAGQRHHGFILSLARRIWPKSIIQKCFPGLGLFMLIEARK